MRSKPANQIDYLDKYQELYGMIEQINMDMQPRENTTTQIMYNYVYIDVHLSEFWKCRRKGHILQSGGPNR